jgi:NAD(P)-dependent dehydrogenase (short-subunit alcohol dehydrogenase family)
MTTPVTQRTHPLRMAFGAGGDARPWDTGAIPPQAGRVAVITGADTGLGREVALQLARHGCAVVMAGIAIERAHRVASEIRAAMPGALIDVEAVDLSDLESVREFAGRYISTRDRLDVLVNNAGIMFAPLTRTADGIEGHFAVNHLGHFALTGLLLPRLLTTPGSRIVTVSSNSHKMGRIDFDDLHAEKGYRRMSAYAQSKLANLLFSATLAHHLQRAGTDTLSVAAHPGQSSTHTGGDFHWSKLFERAISQSPRIGALPILRAATDPDARQDDYHGPSGLLGMRGAPERVDRSPRARDMQLARRLWTLSESLTGARYDFPPPRSDPPESTQ